MTALCRSCDGDLYDTFSLGNQYLSDFRPDDVKPPRYYLNVCWCPKCTLVQLRHSVPRELMYHDRYGFKSGVNDTMRADLRDVVRTGMVASRKPVRRWLDIACNDGTLLSNLPHEGVYRVGVDPVAKYAGEAIAHADRIVSHYFGAAQFTGERPFDVVTSISVFYDMDDPNLFVSDVAKVLADDGVWIVQQNYLLTTLQLNALDNFCHEHITYFALSSLEPLLERHGLEVFSVSTSPVNGGSFRTLIAKKGKRIPDGTVEEQRARERAGRLQEVSAYQEFNRRVQRRLESLHKLVGGLTRAGERVFVYGASTRGGTIWQAAGLDHRELPYAVDRNPEKVGLKIASIGTPIISEQQARELKPEWMLISPWFYADEIMARDSAMLRSGTQAILPLPDVKIV